MAGYQARLFEDGDEEQIVDLLETAFDGWPRFDIQCSPLEHWRWKYLDNPVGPVLIFVAEMDGEIVGVVHCMPCRVHVGGFSILGSNGADVCTHPDHRRKGIYSMISSFGDPIYFERKVLFNFGIETNPILIKKNLEEGPDKVIPHKATLYVKIEDLDRHLQETSLKNPLIKKVGYRIFEKINEMNFKRSFVRNVSPFEIRKTNHFGDTANILVKKVKVFFGYVLERDAAFLNWRYCDPRGGGYHIWSAIHDDHLLGFVVSRENKYQEDYPTGHIVDLICDPSRKDVADALLKRALVDMDEKGVNIVYYLGIQDNPLDDMVKSNGFVNSREQILWNYMEHPLVTEYANTLKRLPSERVYFTYGDIDWI